MILKYFYVLTFLLVLSCKSTDNQETKTIESTLENKKMIEDGYNKGVIVASNKENDCPYVIKIQVNDSSTFLDPVDLPDEFKKDGEAIWFKFTPSRRVKRCDKADPVVINEIKLMD